MTKVHLFFTDEPIPHLRVGANTELGHLYSDDGNTEDLHQAAKEVGLKRRWFQAAEPMPHYDLWRRPLEKAKELYQVADDDEFYQDMERRRLSGRAKDR